MITLNDGYVTDTVKVRKSGNSIIVGIDKDKCDLLEIKEGSMVEIYFRKKGDILKESKNGTKESM